MQRRYKVLASALMSGAFAFGAPACYAQAAAQQSVYEVGSGDVLRINVYGTTAYDAVVQVSAEGNIQVAELGEVAVVGLAAGQIASKLAGDFQRRGILINPVVNVLVEQYRSRTVSILGSVAKPGEYPLDRSGLKLSDLLARSGADLGLGAGIIRVTNAVGAQRDLLALRVMSGELDDPVQANDTIVVMQAPTFFILGEVQRPGSYPVEPGLTMGRAIALAGGLTPRGARNKLKVTRKSGEGAEATAKAKGGDEVVPGDLIRVGSRIF